MANASTLERYEGMLVEFTQPLAVTDLFELGLFGQMVLGLNGRQFNTTNGNDLGNGIATQTQNRLACIVLDDGSSASNPNPIPYLSAADTTGTRRMGDTTQKITGVLNYFTTFTNGVTASGLTGQGCSFGTGPALASTCRGASNANEFQRQQAKIVAAIAGLDADVVGLMDIQNTDVATQDLVTALNAKVGAGTYAAVNSGTFGTDAIKVDILYKPARVNRVATWCRPPAQT